MVEKNLQIVLDEIKNGNPYGEEVTLVGATKFIPVDVINRAISAGLKDISENRAQEFKEKYPLVNKPVNYHFIGSLQKNKVKYLIGKCHLIHSVDSLSLLDEIARQAKNKGVCQNVLLEVNMGVEEQKHGFDLDELESALNYSKSIDGVCVLGLMAMLPASDNQEFLFELASKLRRVYDSYKEKYGFKHLSLGMSNDYALCVKAGSNMIRVGTKIFGKRY